MIAIVEPVGTNIVIIPTLTLTWEATMVAKTFDMAQPAINPDRTEPRSDMFMQSSALYSRINKKSKTSPWLVAGPAIALVVVGGAILFTTGSHPAKPVTSATQPTTSQTVTPAPAVAT